MKDYKKLYKAALSLEKEDYDEALEYLKELAESSDDLDLKYQIGMALYEQQNYQEAIDTFLNIISINDTYPNSYYGLGNVYEALEEYEKAINYYLEAIHYDPSFDAAYFYLAGVYEDLKQISDAINAYKETLRINPEHFGQILTGSLYERDKQYDKALLYTKGPML